MSRKLLRSADRSFGRLAVLAVAAAGRVASPARPGRKSSPLPDPKRILVIKLVGVGDTVLMLTPLSRLRQRFPNARICALVTPLSSGVLADDPRIDETIVYDVLGAGRGPAGLLKMVRTLRRMKFDCVIDFEQHFHCTTLLAYFSGAPTRVGFFFRPAGRGLLYSAPVFLDPDKHMVEAFTDLLAPLGIERARVDRLEPVQVSQQDRDAVSGWLRASGIAEGEVLVGIHPGSGPRSPQRQWGAKNFADIARMIRDKSGAQVVVTGTAEERSLADEIVRLAARPGVRSAAGRFTLKQVAALLARCSLFVSTDTGPMHISASVGTPTVGIFGPQTARRYAPFGRGNAAVWKPTACSPCVQIHEGRTYDCKDAACIDGIGLAEVWAEVEQRLPLRAGE